MNVMIKSKYYDILELCQERHNQWMYKIDTFKYVEEDIKKMKELIEELENAYEIDKGYHYENNN